jgi:hypothetical protein
VLEYAKQEEQQREESDPWACTLLESIWKNELFGEQASQNLKESFCELLQTKDLLGGKQEINARSITRLLKSLGFKRSKKKTGGKIWFLISKDEVKQQLIAHSMSDLIESLQTSNLSNFSNLSNSPSLRYESCKSCESEFCGNIKQKENTKSHPFYHSIRAIKHEKGSRLPESSELYWAEKYFQLHPSIPKFFFVKDMEREFATNFQSFWEAFWDWLKDPTQPARIGVEEKPQENQAQKEAERMPEEEIKAQFLSRAQSKGTCEFCRKKGDVAYCNGFFLCFDCYEEERKEENGELFSRKEGK